MDKKSILLVGTFIDDKDTPYPQAKLISDYLRSEGYKTSCVSALKFKVLRLLDICFHILIGQHNFLFIQVFSGQAFIYTVFAIILGLLRKKRIIVFLRGGNLPKFMRKGQSFKVWILKQAELLIAPSRYLQHEFSKLGIETIVIPNIIDVSNYTFKPRSRISLKILWLRRFIEIYNPMMAVKVVKKLKEDYNEVFMTMAGGGDSSQLKEMIFEEGLANNINVLGFISKTAINDLGQAHDIFINTARIDNVPVTVIEAMAMGLPVISTNVGGIPYFLKHGVNALLVDNNDVEGMVYQIKKLFLYPNLCENLSHHGHETAMQYNWNQVKKKYLEIFN